MDKSETRKLALEARRAITPEAADVKNEQIFNRLTALPFLHDAREALCYVSSKDNEADTHRLIDWFLERGVRTLVPLSRPNRVLEWSCLENRNELAPARFGILEPRPEFIRLATPSSDAVVIVPGVAFSPDGQRIGYGGGYYDSFLADHKGIRVGVAFDAQIIESFQTDAHDVLMDYIVTESRTFTRA
jgi:5-formyltetrahydrofolate cyclo-ligase